MTEARTIRDAAPGSPPIDPQFAMPHVMDCMPVGIGVFDMDGRLLRNNPAFAEMTRETVSTLADMGPPRWTGYGASGAPLAPAENPGVAALAGRIATPGHEFHFADEAGSGRWFNVSAVPLRHPSCEGPMGLAVVIEDIGDRKRAAARLAVAEGWIRAFSDNSSCGLWVADLADGRFRFVNPAIARLWPGTVRNGRMTDWLQSVHAEDRGRVAEQRADVAGGKSQTLTYRLIDDDGSIVRHLRETSFPIPSDSGSSPAMGGIVESIAIDLPIYLLSAEGEGDLVSWLHRAGYRVKSFATAQALLAIVDVLSPGCLLLDQRGKPPEMAGIVDRLRLISALPIVVLEDVDEPTDTPWRIDGAGIVRVGGLGDGSLLETALAGVRISLAIGADEPPPAGSDDDPAIVLTTREMDVLQGLMEGGTNKSIGRSLGLSPRTVEAHRARLMDRLQVKTLSALIQLAQARKIGRGRS